MRKLDQIDYREKLNSLVQDALFGVGQVIKKVGNQSDKHFLELKALLERLTQNEFTEQNLDELKKIYYIPILEDTILNIDVNIRGKAIPLSNLLQRLIEEWDRYRGF